MGPYSRTSKSPLTYIEKVPPPHKITAKWSKMDQNVARDLTSYP